MNPVVTKNQSVRSECLCYRLRRFVGDMPCYGCASATIFHNSQLVAFHHLYAVFARCKWKNTSNIKVPRSKRERKTRPQTARSSLTTSPTPDMWLKDDIRNILIAITITNAESAQQDGHPMSSLTVTGLGLQSQPSLPCSRPSGMKSLRGSYLLDL